MWNTVFRWVAVLIEIWNWFGILKRLQQRSNVYTCISRLNKSFVSYNRNVCRNMTKPTKWLCAQWRLRSARESAHSDQSLCCVLNGQLRTQAFFLRTTKTLTRLAGCPGWSESSLGAHSLRWFCHVAAHVISSEMAVSFTAAKFFLQLWCFTT